MAETVEAKLFGKPAAVVPSFGSAKNGAVSIIDVFDLFYRTDAKSEQEAVMLPDDMLFPVMRRLSFNPKNHELCMQAYEQFMYVPRDMLKMLLYYGNDRCNKYFKSIKSVAFGDDSKVIALLRPHLKKYFGWSDRELNANMPVISQLAVDKQFIDRCAAMFGLNEADAKVLGIKYAKPKPSRVQAGSLFSFVKK